MFFWGDCPCCETGTGTGTIPVLCRCGTGSGTGGDETPNLQLTITESPDSAGGCACANNIGSDEPLEAVCSGVGILSFLANLIGGKDFGCSTPTVILLGLTIACDDVGTGSGNWDCDSTISVGAGMQVTCFVGSPTAVGTLISCAEDPIEIVFDFEFTGPGTCGCTGGIGAYTLRATWTE